jgi:hypothetical protein
LVAFVAFVDFVVLVGGAVFALAGADLDAGALATFVADALLAAAFVALAGAFVAALVAFFVAALRGSVPVSGFAVDFFGAAFFDTEAVADLPDFAAG